MNIRGYIDVTVEGVEMAQFQGFNQPPLSSFEPDLTEQLSMHNFQQEAQAKTDQAVLMNQEILALKQAYEALQQDYQVAVQAGQGLFEDRARLFNENLQLKQLLAPLQNTIFGQAVQQEEQSAQPEPTMGYGPSGRMSPQ